VRDADRTFRQICKSGSMAETVNVIVAIEDHERLLAIIGDRNCPLMHVQRAKKGSLFAKRLVVLEVARLASVSRPPSDARNGGVA